MRTLEQLQTLSRTALEYPVLVKIASRATPNAAAEEAVQKGFTHEEVQSCRWLAIIRRDFGQDGFEASIRFFKESCVADLLEQQVAPKIQLLEKMTGTQLRIVKPEDRGLTLLEYLRQAHPAGLNVGLTLGDISIAIRWGVRKSEYDGRTHYSSESQYSIRTTGEAALDKHGVTSGTLGEGQEKDFSYLQMRFLQFILEVIGTRTSRVRLSEPSVFQVLMKRLEESNEVLPPHLDQNNEVRSLVYAGNVEGLKELLVKIRGEVALVVTKAEYMEYYDFEVERQVRAVEKRKCYLDPTIPLLDKVRKDVVDGFIGATVIPGSAEKRYNFFLYIEDRFFVEKWEEVLAANGYGRSVLFSTFRPSDGYELVATGQVHGLLLDDNIGYSSKADWLNPLQRHYHDKPAPQFIWYGIHHEHFAEEFSKFLQENFPLE